jgi:collagen type IX alpha
LGLPEQFSFISTFRTRKLAKSPWHIIRISDIQNKAQFLITLNPRKETIEFSITDFEGRLQTVVFSKAPVRCNNIHHTTNKLYAVNTDNIIINVMCDKY